MKTIWWRQILAVVRLELRKTFFARRGLWIYLLALAPVALFTVQAIAEHHFGLVREEMAQNGRHVTQEDFDQIQVGATRDQVVAKLGPPPVTYSRERHERKGRDRVTISQETVRYSDGRRELILTYENGVVVGKGSSGGISFGQNTYIFAGVFEFFFIRLAVFFGCLGIFMNLFRGEMLDKSLHYYLLAPLRREVLLAGKYLAGLTAATVIFTLSTALQLIASMAAFPSSTVSRYLYQEHGLANVGAYLGVTVLACIGYGSVFLAAGLLFRNPIVPAALVLIWEAANPLLPALLKKFSVIYYLKSLCPVQIPLDPGMPALFAMLISNSDPVSAYVAVIGLLVLAAFVLWLSSLKIRRLEINYTTE